MSIELPVWLIQASIAAIVMIVLMYFASRYKDHPRYGWLVLVVLAVLVYFGVVGGVRAVWSLFGG